MARIEGIRIQNYRALRDVRLGKTFETQRAEPLPALLAVIGPNGSGKSSLIDAFGFIGDCLSIGVEEACDRPHRGGFERLRTRGQSGPIEFEIYYREEPGTRPISYTLHIDLDQDGRPYVGRERLRQRRRGQSSGKPFSFLDVERGKGVAWAGDASDENDSSARVEVELEDPRRLGITTLGNLASHPRIVELRQFLEGWYLSYFVPDLARQLPMAGAQKHLDRTGENLANYVQYVERQHPRRFGQVLSRIAEKIPGVQQITAERQKDGRLLIQFNDRGYVDPFYAQDMSDGTLKMFAYLLLLEDPEPAPLIGIEEPENGLHHQLLQPLAFEMKQVASRKDGPQILVTTHSPYFVDALRPEEVWILGKDEHGFSNVVRAADVPSVRELYAEGIPLGSLWYSNHFGRGNP
ncbi:MAG TPA: AAA family ATPase [Longimicrobiaceae bacterium]|jgi:predicted ATPase